MISINKIKKRVNMMAHTPSQNPTNPVMLKVRRLVQTLSQNQTDPAMLKVRSLTNPQTTSGNKFKMTKVVYMRMNHELPKL